MGGRGQPSSTQIHGRPAQEPRQPLHSLLQTQGPTFEKLTENNGNNRKGEKKGG